MPTYPLPTPFTPADASVFDSYWKQLARTAAATVGPWVGSDDPVNTIMGVGGALKFPVKPLTSLKAFGTGATAAADDILARAKALFLERGGGDSPARMAQALKDAGYPFGALRTAAEKREAHSLVQRLMGEAKTLSRIDPASPFSDVK
jgi:hypothetical protein